MDLTESARKRIEQNLFFQRYQELGVKEALFSDTIAAVGHLQQQIIKYATPELIGRKIINVEKTKEATERFPLASKAVGYIHAEGTVIRLSGDKEKFVTVEMDRLAQSSEQWTKKFVEDASPHAIENIKRRISQSLGLNETHEILSLYNSIEDEDLAGGAPLNQGGKRMDWDSVLALHNAVKGENWKPTVLVLNETQLSQLLLDNHFIEKDNLATNETDPETGIIRRALGMDVQSSTLVPPGTAFAIDRKIAGIMLIRRDITVEDWSDVMTEKYGLKASTRFGLGILRSNGVAKMINIKTTL